MEIKERIQQKAEELFKLYGIRSITMDEIASQLGISKKTIYQYFTDKEEVVAAVFNAMMSRNRICCLQGKEQAENAIHEIFLSFDMLQEMFRNMNPAILFDLEKYHPEIYKQFHEYKYGFIYQIVKQNLERGIEEKLYRSELNIDILTRFRIESSMLPFNSYIFPSNQTQLVEIEKEILEHFLYGISNDKGVKLLEKYKKQRQPKS